MNLFILLTKKESDEEHTRDGTERPRGKSREELERAAKEQEPAADAGAQANKRSTHGGADVDKYFGTKLPPVCAELGCYVTDDGTRFYCVNASCQKHKKRLTKHTRRGRPRRSNFVYFRCPRCNSRNVNMHLFSNQYECRACQYIWSK